MLMPKKAKLALALSFALAAATPVFAQQTSASLSGRVQSEGAPVAGADVTILHVESGTVSRTTTDANGRYSARGLRVGGPYMITIEKDGVVEVRENVYLSLGEANSVNATLAAVQQLETVEVVASYAGDVFSSEKMGTGTQLGLEQLEALPTIQRNLQDIARLDPRVVQTDKNRLELSAGGQNPRFNSIRIDGVNTSDTFGLESSNFPTLRQPVSIDAIEAVNIDLSNYDVTITGATGAVVDAVTKSGTNKFSGSVYYVYRDPEWVRDNPDGSTFNAFNEEITYGATFGGPIIKDTLFFFLTYEKYERDRPAPSFGPIGSGASNIVNITNEQIAEAQRIARDVWGIDIGTFESPDGIKQELEEYSAKIDWNINESHRASFRYSKLEQVDPVLTGMSNTSLSLNSRWYDIAKTFDSAVVQLFSDWTSSFSTELKVGRRNYDSLSNVYAYLPQIGIGLGNTANDPDQDSSPYLNFGTDEFRHGNQVETETWTGLAAGYLYLGDHTVKFGADYESNDIYNLYAQNTWGSYTFASLDHFRNGQYWQYRLNAPVPGMDYDSIAMTYTHRNLGLFLQDTWAVNNNLTLTYGIRADIPDLDDVGTHNLLVQEIYGYDNRHTLDKELIQPRFGFNYTFDTELMTQLRGGIGLFQGIAANVWVGNSYQNSGFGLIGYNAQLNANMSQEEREAIWASLPFRPDINNPTRPSPAAGYQMMVNLMEEGIEQPSIWKANLALDFETGWWDSVATIELSHNKVHNGLYFERLDLGRPTGRGQDGRPMYWSNMANASGFRANGNAELLALRNAGLMPAGYENVTGWHNDGVILMKNTDEGRSTQLTLSLNKPQTDTWGWSLAYTYTHATEVSPLTSSRAISNWNNRAIWEPNENVAATSNYEIRDRVLGTLSWRRAFFGDYFTSATLIYEGRSGRPYSYRYRNDMNGDGYTNDLFYVPAGRGDVIFTGGQAMEEAFFTWLATEPLQNYAGQVAPRNAFRSGFFNRFDLRFVQELPGFWRDHKSELIIDVMNIGNLIDKDWGRIEDYPPFTDRRLVNFRGIDPATGKYIYDFQESQVFTPTLMDAEGESRWAVQATFRYRF